jgi:bifunctional N-acetylglucosamine-1-phosphate-uridyltransferase/glucosamine-1-phosphate-acetyltransferase GlmU-like protein
MLKKLFNLYKDEGLINSISRLLNKFANHFRGYLFINSSATIGRSIKIIGRRSISFGKNSGFGDNCRVEAHSSYLEQKFLPLIEFGDNCSFGNSLHIGAITEIKIGSGVLAGSNILIIDHNHGDIFNVGKEDPIPPAYRKLTSLGKIKIGNNVWIGDGVKIFSGSDIGDGCIIAANASISKKVPPNSLCTGQNKFIS